MSNGKRQTGFFGAAGVLTAGIIIAAFLVGGNILQAQGKGVLTVQVMDAPAALQNLWLDIDSVEIQGEEGGWTEVALPESETQHFDLLTLQTEALTLAEDEIPAGSYSIIKMQVSDASAIYEDGTEVDLTVPSGVIKVLFKTPVNIVVGEETTVLIDLQPEDVNSIAISHKLNLRPVIKAVVTPQES